MGQYVKQLRKYLSQSPINWNKIYLEINSSSNLEEFKRGNFEKQSPWLILEVYHDLNKRERLRANIAAAPVAKLATDLINSWSNQKTDLIKFLPYPGEFDQKPNISPDTARILIGLVQDEKIHPKFAALVAQDWHLIEKIAQD